jgi:hypothetical protein
LISLRKRETQFVRAAQSGSLLARNARARETHTREEAHDDAAHDDAAHTTQVGPQRNKARARRRLSENAPALTANHTPTKRTIPTDTLQASSPLKKLVFTTQRPPGAPVLAGAAPVALAGHAD